MRIFFSSPHPRCRWHIPRPRHPFTPPRSGRKAQKNKAAMHRPNTLHHNTAANPIKTPLRVKHKKQPPRNSTGAAFIYSISIFQSGFAPAAKATKELNTRFHRLSTHAHPNKSGVIFAAFIGLYRDITKAICNPLRPCFIAYKRLYCVRGYKIAACAAVLFPCVYHALHPR